MCGVNHALRVVQGRTVATSAAPADPVVFQLDCVEAFVTSRVVRGFSAVTIENETGVLERMLSALGKPVWEATADDVDRVVGAMAADGLAASTRRGYVQALKSFHRFLITRRAAEIEALFGVRLTNPIDEFNASRHVGSDSPGQLAPPSAGTGGRVLRLPQGQGRVGPQVRSRGPGLCVVPDAVSRGVAGG